MLHPQATLTPHLLHPDRLVEENKGTEVLIPSLNLMQGDKKGEAAQWVTGGGGGDMI